MSKLLINESPLQVLPTLAVKVGLNEAIFLQQLHYWISNPKTQRRQYEGQWYIRNTFEEWQETNFPFWSIATLKRLTTKLKKAGLILTTHRLNKIQIDRTQWYTINYDLLEAFTDESEVTTRKCQSDTIGKCQSDTIEVPESVKVIPPKYQDDTMTKCQNDTTNNQRLETNTETKKKAAKKPPPPAAETYREVFKRYPSQEVWPDLAPVTDMDKWREVCDGWRLQRYKRTNFTGLLNWYENGIPDYARKGKQNGTHQRSDEAERNRQANAKLGAHDFRNNRAVP